MLEEFVRGGARGGFFSDLPEDVAERLLAGAIRITVPAGALIYRDGESPRVIVVMSGLLRVFLRSVDGRQVTVRYVRDGDVAGLLLVLGGPGPTSIQAMTRRRWRPFRSTRFVRCSLRIHASPACVPRS